MDERHTEEAVLVDQTEAMERLQEALEDVRRRFDERTDDWEYGVLLAFRQHLRAVGIERRLIDPVQAMMMARHDAVVLARRRAEGKTGTPKPSLSVAAMAYAAAAVTTLRVRHKMKLGEALAEVSRASGIRERDIREFRDNLSRRRVPKASTAAHDAAMKEMRDREYTADDILAAVAGLRRFVE